MRYYREHSFLPYVSHVSSEESSSSAAASVAGSTCSGVVTSGGTASSVTSTSTTKFVEAIPSISTLQPIFQSSIRRNPTTTRDVIYRYLVHTSLQVSLLAYQVLTKSYELVTLPLLGWDAGGALEIVGCSAYVSASNCVVVGMLCYDIKSDGYQLQVYSSVMKLLETSYHLLKHQNLPLSFQPTLITVIPSNVFPNVDGGSSGSTPSMGMEGFLVTGFDNTYQAFLVHPSATKTTLQNDIQIAVIEKKHFIKDYLPELERADEAPDSVMCMRVLQYEGYRVVVYGTMNGVIRASATPLHFSDEENKIVEAFVCGPITSLDLHLEKSRVDDSKRSFLRCDVTVATMDSAFLFTDVFAKGLENPRRLVPAQFSDDDAIFCSCFMDTSLSGSRNVVVGTKNGLLVSFTKNGLSSEADLLRSSVLCLSACDLDEDGIEELVVSTVYGIHIFQADSDYVADKVIRVIQMLSDIE